MKKGDAITIRWRDHRLHPGTWGDRTKALWKTFETRGYFVEETEEYIAVANSISLDDDEDMYYDVVVIVKPLFEKPKLSKD